MRNSTKIDPIVKKKIGLEKLSDKEAIELIKTKKKFACKPCWELKYCPYGPVVEDYPSLPFTIDEALESNEIYKGFLKTKKFGGKPITKEREAYLKKYLKEFDPAKFPKEIHPEILEMKCNIFGHLCPVFFVAEAFTETETERRRGRYIPFTLKMRIVRRDNHTCQSCGKHLKDTEVEFDHIIPISKGGSTDEHNIRLTCYTCNREKTNKVLI